jgi:hypothetical protein
MLSTSKPLMPYHKKPGLLIVFYYAKRIKKEKTVLWIAYKKDRERKYKTNEQFYLVDLERDLETAQH